MRPKTVTRFFIVFCVLLSCMMLAVAYMTVSSYTNYANDPEALRSLPVLESTVSEESLSPEGDESLGLYSVQSMIENSDTIVVGRFNGGRSYGYQTFASGVEVIRSIKGDLAVGQTVQVFEPMRISRAKEIVSKLDVDDSKLSDDDEARIIRPSAQGSYWHGKGFMKEGNTYLFFLQRKVLPPQYVAPHGASQYRMYDSPYARILLADVTPISVSEGVSIVSFEESTNTDQFVVYSRAKEVYEENCKHLIDQFL